MRSHTRKPVVAAIDVAAAVAGGRVMIFLMNLDESRYYHRSPVYVRCNRLFQTAVLSAIHEADVNATRMLEQPPLTRLSPAAGSAATTSTVNASVPLAFCRSHHGHANNKNDAAHRRRRRSEAVRVLIHRPIDRESQGGKECTGLETRFVSSYKAVEIFK